MESKKSTNIRKQASPPEKKIRSLERWWMQNSHRARPYQQVPLSDGTFQWVTSDGKPVVRDTRREQAIINAYFDDIKRMSPDYFDLLVSMAGSPTFQPMSPDNRVSVLIPAYNEGQNLYQLLALYANQRIGVGKAPLLHSEIYEINILVNRPVGTAGDNSIDEIERFKNTNDGAPFMPAINYYDIQFNPSQSTVGNARKHISDVTLLRSLQRTTPYGALYLETEDADLDFVDPRTIINIIGKFDQYPHLDALRGVQERTRADLVKNDWIFLKERLWNFTEVICRRPSYRPQFNPEWHGFWNRVITGGWNTAFTAEALAMIGGYTSTKGIGEDTEIGEKITRVHGLGSDDRLDVNLDVIATVPSRSSSSIRRLLTEKIRATDRYIPSEFMDEGVNDLIRLKSIDELLEDPALKRVERLSDDNALEFRKMICAVCNTAISLYHGEEIFDSIMFHAGFQKADYSLAGTLEILNWGNVKRKLDTYRANFKSDD